MLNTVCVCYFLVHGYPFMRIVVSIKIQTNPGIGCFIQVYMYIRYYDVALRPNSTAIMVMAGRSVHKTTLFPGQA